MDIKRSDFILILDLEDIHGEKMRVADTAEFTIRVWTNDPTHYLTFKRRDIISDDYNDRIAIDKMQMECLHSGVVVYDYDYSKWNADFSSTDEKYNKVKTVVTDVYWRNVINADNPCNVVNYQTIEHIYDLIEAERLDREQEFHELKDYVGKDFTDKLNAEIKRSNEVDIEFHKLIKSNKEECDTKNTELNDKLDKEIQRSNEVDTEILNLIKGNADSGKETTDSINDALNAEIARSSQKDADLENAIDTEVTRATNAETVINTKLEGEIERAKTAEGAIRDAVENERDRAIAKETLINDSLTSEISRAKQVETDITTNLQALKTAVETEKQRSADKDTEHTNSLNQLSAKIDTEIERAKAEEARIEALITSNANADSELSDKLDAEIDRAKKAEKDINDTLTSEITRAKASEKANADAIEVINGDSSTIGSIAHSLADAKHYTDDEVAKAKQYADTQLQLTIDSYATKKHVDDRIKAVIGTAPEALDTLGEIATVLNGNGDAITAINGVLTGKANSSDVYTKSETDNKVKTVNDALNAEISRSTAIDDILTSDLQIEVSRAKAAEKANADAIAILNGDKNTIGSIAHCLDDSKHYTDDEIAKIKAEQNTALANFATKNEVNAVDGKLTAHISNADSTYAKKSDIYTKTEVDDLIDGVDVTSQIKPISDRVTALEGIDHTQYLTSHQSLTDYAKKTETTAIKDENGNVITEMVIDNSSADDSVELYTKEQCDERFALKGETGGSVDLSNYYTKSEVDTQFAKIWVGTQSEYDAITTKNNSTLYIIK